LNIYFNIKAFFEKEQLLRGAIYEMFWNRMMPVVNGTAYPLGIAIGLYLCWPVVRAVRSRANRLPQSGKESLDGLTFARARSVWIADYTSWMTMGLWSVSGVVFAWWISLEVKALGEEVPRNLYAHFVPSQILWGLIAAVQVFFLTTALTLRAFLPVLVDLRQTGGDDAGRLIQLQQRSGWYFGVAISTPFVAMLLVTTDRDYIPQMSTIAGVGLLCSLLAWYLWRQIQRDVEALSIALEPGRDSLPGGGETSESFWTSSR
jgi:hypothetical protein